MKCQAVRTYLLSMERPDQPPSTAADHLAQCPACRAWQHRLVQMERHAAFLPVPTSAGMARLKTRLLAGSRGKSGSGELPWQQRERRLKRLALTSALCAALVLIAVGLWVWRATDQPEVAARPAPVEDALLASLMQRNLNLAAARTPQQRLEVLANLADDLQSEGRTLAEAADAQDLATLARLYRQVVRDGIITQARALPAADRATLLGPLADRLAQVSDEANQLAARVPAGKDRSLREIAAAARDGDRQLRSLLRGESS